MGFIVEITARSGRVIERHRFDRPTATIGRAFDNDIIVHDPYVDTDHLRISNDLNGLAVEVVSENGHTVVGKRHPTEPRMPIASGTEVVIGKTHLRIFSTSHKVAPVLKFERVDRLFTSLTRPSVVIFLTIAYLAFDSGNAYLARFSETTWAEDALTLVSPLLPAAGWAAFWALISRISRGEPRFLHHWVAVLFALTLVIVFDRIAEVIAFNLGNLLLNDVINFISMAVVLAILLVINMRFAFRQRVWVRHAFAYATTSAVIAYLVLSSQSFERDFKPFPEFDSTLMPSAFLLRPNITEERFLANVDRLFEFPSDPLETPDNPVNTQRSDDPPPALSTQ